MVGKSQLKSGTRSTLLNARSGQALGHQQLTIDKGRSLHCPALRLTIYFQVRVMEISMLNEKAKVRGEQLR